MAHVRAGLGMRGMARRRIMASAAREKGASKNASWRHGIILK